MIAKLVSLGKIYNFANPWTNLSIRTGYLLLHQVDLLLTVSSTSRGLSELNPFMKNILDSPADLILYKIVIPLMIAWLLPARLITPALALMVFVISWNLGQLLV